MKRHNEMTNSQLAAVIERFMIHYKLKETSTNPIVRDGARHMCDIEIWEMWALTQI